MNDLEKYFHANEGRLIHKWMHFFEIYDRHFSRFRGKEVTILEVGVSQGGSLQMWKHYFGDKARIFGIDNDPRCKALEEENIKIFIGSQSDRAFLRTVRGSIPPIDILIDDGGHTMEQQIVTFEEMSGAVRTMASICAKTCTRRIGSSTAAATGGKVPSSNTARNGSIS